MNIYYILLYFFVYSFLGWCTEVSYAAVVEHKFVNRGFLNGPVCPIYGVGVTAVVALLEPYKENLILLYVSSVVVVTLLEGVTGWAMDKIFHNKWWDYSDKPLNIGGYICLSFSLMWGVACVIVMDFVHPLLHTLLTFIPQVLGIVLISVFGAIMLIDLSVTSSAIFKFNKRLSSMEKIAGELHEISDQIGEDIYEKVVFALEKSAAPRQKLDEAAFELREKTQETVNEWSEKKQEVSEEIGSRIAELKSHYQELGNKTPKISRRLVKAFPKMESRNYKLQLEEFRKKFNEKHK
ncbi:putative membrane protein [Muricomes intestini]|uniref:Putative membrane protein n=1 Tax=Muricomes intestini TaxID=1796634 RepID=A0A4R3JZC1_9FIRM|nr:putative ABC transporter permease [Muricomes intestini]TCS74251.1 putative membrane protein [Muricomes intestini]